MTTPERLRARQLEILENEEKLQRRQSLIGWLVLFFGVVLVAQAVYFNDQQSDIVEAGAGRDSNTRACIARNTAAQNDVLRIRSTLASREARLDRREVRITARWQNATQRLFIEGSKLQAAGETEAVRELYEETVRIWGTVDRDRAEVEAVREEIEQERSENPIPDFPEGTCE